MYFFVYSYFFVFRSLLIEGIFIYLIIHLLTFVNNKAKTPPKRGPALRIRNRQTRLGLFRAQDSEHLSAASRANTRHCASLNATLALHGNFFGVFHLSFGFTLDAVSFSHINLLINKLINGYLNSPLIIFF